MSKARKFVFCPFCNTRIRETKLEQHKQKKCPKRSKKFSLLPHKPPRHLPNSTINDHTIPMPSTDPKTVLCPKCSQKAKILWYSKIDNTAHPLCPNCYSDLPKHIVDEKDYYALFLPVFSRNEQKLWVLTSFLDYSFVELASYIERCINVIRYKSIDNKLFIRDKVALFHLVEHLSTIEQSTAISSMTFEEFKEKNYSFVLQKSIKLKRTHENLLNQCQKEYEEYAKLLQRKRDFIQQIKVQIAQVKEQAFDVQKNKELETQMEVQDENLLFGTVSWYILPPGEHPFSQIITYFNHTYGSTNNIHYEPERLYKIYDLKPNKIYGGKGGFIGYIAFYFELLKVAVLECPLSGNAIYIIKGDWKKLSQLTKAELLWYHEEEVIRIVHSGDWFSRLKHTLFSSES